MENAKAVQKRVRRTVVRVRRKQFEKEVVIGALVQALRSEADTKKLRAAVRMIASDDELWAAMEELQRIGERLHKAGLSRWAI